MQIGIISDTHDHHRNVCKAIEVFTAHKVQAVLHAGDMILPSTAQLFSQLTGVQFIAVFGNCDVDRHSLRATIESFGGQVCDRVYDGRLDGKAIYMVHTPHTIQRAAETAQYDLIVHGHTHRDCFCQVGKTFIVNPGEATDSKTGLGQVVLLNTTDMSFTIEPLD
jgi:putative phosphoesterase